MAMTKLPGDRSQVFSCMSGERQYGGLLEDKAQLNPVHMAPSLMRVEQVSKTQSPCDKCFAL